MQSFIEEKQIEDKPTGTYTLNLRFPGQYFDKESSFSYNINRYYNPTLGRYMQSDPLGLEGGENSFVYVGDNPLIKIDSEGLWDPFEEVQPNFTSVPSVQDISNWNQSIIQHDKMYVVDMDCYSKCLKDRNWNLWKYVFATSFYPKKLLPPFRVPNPKQRLTTLPSVISLYTGNRAYRDFMRKIPNIQRLSTAILMIDGAHDWYLIFDCAIQCGGRECTNK